MGFLIAVVFYDAYPLVDRISADQFFRLIAQIQYFQCK